MLQLEDMNMDQPSEEVAVQLAAQGVIGKRVDEMEPGFMMALDYMIKIAENDQDDQVIDQYVHPSIYFDYDYLLSFMVIHL